MRHLFLVILLLAPCKGWGEHPSDVQKHSADGEHLKALVAFESLPKRRRSGDTVLAAGKSAWALSLPEKAVPLLDGALHDETLPASVIDKAKITLSRGIIEYQEGRFDTASAFADRTILMLKEPSNLRAKAYYLSGQSLSKLHSVGLAEEKFIKARDEAAQEERPDILLALGRTEMILGKYEEARKNLERLPLDDERTPIAIRYLAVIALESGRTKDAGVWLEKGRADYGDHFLDSWVDYGLILAAIAENDLVKVRRIRASAVEKHAPSDPWLGLLEAAAESYEWRSINSEVGEQKVELMGGKDGRSAL